MLLKLILHSARVNTLSNGGQICYHNLAITTQTFAQRHRTQDEEHEVCEESRSPLQQSYERERQRPTLSPVLRAAAAVEQAVPNRSSTVLQLHPQLLDFTHM